ncbi:MAG: c-type cytochrome [Pseudomonadota bacterium]|nr:c-type cytochrome [Pseudomonadota bacterium]
MGKQKKSLRFHRYSLVLMLLLAGLGSGGAMDTVLASSHESENLARQLHGGRLYDNWLRETGEDAPEGRHPAYPADYAPPDGEASTWLCHECHGWDYMGKDGAYGEGEHYTGIKGINGIFGKHGTDPTAVLAILKDDTHGYGDLMDEKDLLSLALFVTNGQVYMDHYIDRETGQVLADQTQYRDYFQSICINCHGYGGQQITSMPPLGDQVRENPWAALHKIVNGHAEGMPALGALDEDVWTGILAYAQTLPTRDLCASIGRGGRLYDNWEIELDESPPFNRHPLYPEESRYAENTEKTWRCAECHGWDYRGKAGAYGEGKHFTGIKGVDQMKGVAAERIISVLTDKRHGYGKLFDNRDLNDLAAFVGQGQLDMDDFIDRETGKAKGNPDKHKELYQTLCATCHGVQGGKIRTMPALGKAANANPWLTLHKMLNGHPDEEMPAMRAFDMSTTIDVLSYIQTLPKKKQRGG